MADQNLVEFTDQNFDAEVIKSTIPVVVDFWAEWCGPCKMLTPILADIAGGYVGKVKIGKLNVDENPGVASKYAINSIPTLLFFKGGNIAEQQIGLLAKPGLIKKIDQFIA